MSAEHDMATMVVNDKLVGVKILEDGRVFLCWWIDGQWSEAAFPIHTFGDSPIQAVYWKDVCYK